MHSIFRSSIPLVLALATTSLAAEPATKKALTFGELMKFRTIEDPVLAADGQWIAYELIPDRGDGEAVAVSADGRRRHTIPHGGSPALSRDGRWLTAQIKPSLEAVETAEDDPPEPGFALLDTGSGELLTWDRVDRAAISEDGRWLAILHKRDSDEAKDGGNAEEASEGEAEEEIAGSAESAASEAETDEEGEDEKKERLGATLRLRHLEDGAEIDIEHVEDFAFDETSSWLAYAIAAPGGANSFQLRELGAGLEAEARSIHVGERGRYTALTWAPDLQLLAWIASQDDADGEPGDGELWIWQGQSGEARAVAASGSAPDGWFVPSVNELAWSRDGARLFYGTRPRPQPKPDEPEDDAFDPYDLEALLAKTELDVWHVDDPLIKTNERHEWDDKEKDRTYRAVYHLEGARQGSVQLGDRTVRGVEAVDNPRAALGLADTPYLRQRTFEGFFSDLYWISLEDGHRKTVAEKVPGLDDNAKLSPDGRHVAWFEDGDWHLFDADTGSSRNLTSTLDVPFADEDHDYPRAVDSHGIAGWLEDGSAVLIYDRFDIWSFPADGGSPRNLTGGLGRNESMRLRVVDEDADEPFVDPAQRLLLHGYREKTKAHGFWSLLIPAEPSADGAVQDPAVESLLEGEKAFTFLARAEDADRLLYTRESYREFPDLWLAGASLENPRKLSDANPQVSDYAWGHAELVRFTDADGRPSDAVLIRPEDLEEGERCPVLTYYYRFFSQRLHRFNEPKVNHRPSFPVYASHGYCVFLPDVRFEIGRPGFSSTKALVPALQRIVDLGIADPDALGLHGHSWSGYQTAHVITQTNLFAAAVAGAPVSNMTSAYGGIRYGTGLARQFQYEQGQSRLGASLWEARDHYIDNSPLFFADRIETPLLIQFGDVDEAVPWTQGIELYLAMRRLDKEAVFLQYHGEPHHLKKYANKLDYSIKMKEFFDHYLKGAPAPVWLTEGVPYRGEDSEKSENGKK